MLPRPQDLRGLPLYLVFAPGPPADGHAGTIAVSPGGRVACHASDSAAWDALALVTGESTATLAGARLLVDAAGWLRSFRPAGTSAAWDDPAVLAAAMRDIAATLLAPPDAGHHHH